ncbi:MAG: PGPGW domain-containing protein [Desulfobacterales bacterium]
MLEWIQSYETLFYWVGGISLAAFAATLAIIPWLVLRIPEDYFAAGRRRVVHQNRHWPPGVLLLLRILKNAAGAVFVTAGLVMLLTPGQGLLTIIAGLGLMNFPGKFRLQRWLISRGSTLKLINRFRVRRGRPPLTL